jgi:hypothetical protein
MSPHPQGDPDADPCTHANQQCQTDDLPRGPLDLAHPFGTASIHTKDSPHDHLPQKGAIKTAFVVVFIAPCAWAKSESQLLPSALVE